MQLAWRNLWRNVRRTVLTIIAIAFATGIVVFSHGLQVSTHETSILATTRIFQGALQVQRKDYFDDPQIYRTISEPDQAIGRINSLPGVTATTGRAIGFALLSSKERTYGVQIVGVDPQSEKELSTIPALVREGAYLESIDSSEILVGAALARNLNVQVGEEITLLGQGKDGSLAAAILKVSGVYESGSSEIDRALAQIPLATFRDLFYMSNESHILVAQVDSLANLKGIQSQIIKELDDPALAVLRWDQITPGLKQAQEFDRITNWIFLVSLILIVVFGILNTFLMSILERTKEFGMLLALGMRPIKITGLILCECLQLVTIGAIAGSILGAIVILYFNHSGFVIPGTKEFLSLWNLPEALYPRVTIEALITGPLTVLGCSLLLVIPFSLRPYWLKPVEAMQS